MDERKDKRGYRGRSTVTMRRNRKEGRRVVWRMGMTRKQRWRRWDGARGKEEKEEIGKSNAVDKERRGV